MENRCRLQKIKRTDRSRRISFIPYSTDQDSYPSIEEILDQLGNAKFFSALDLSSEFHQTSMNPNSKKYTAFSTPKGHIHYNRMPFGLKNAPATFQRMIDTALRGLINKHCFAYLNDIIIFRSTRTQQKLSHNTTAIERIRTQNTAGQVRILETGTGILRTSSHGRSHGYLSKIILRTSRLLLGLLLLRYPCTSVPMRYPGRRKLPDRAGYLTGILSYSNT